MRLNNYSVLPPGGWRYFINSTWIQGDSWNQLLRKITVYCRDHSLERPSDAAVEHQLCENLPTGFCMNSFGQPIITEAVPAFSISQITGFTQTMISWFGQGLARVSRPHAESRAAICVNCRANVPMEGCKHCAGKALRDAVAAFVANSKTNYDDRLNVCNACGCSLRAKIWLPFNVLWPNMDQSQKGRLVPGCWLLNESVPDKEPVKIAQKQPAQPAKKGCAPCGKR